MNTNKFYRVTELTQKQKQDLNGGSDLTDDIWRGIGWVAGYMSKSIILSSRFMRGGRA